jgi:hypothetical protein
MGISRVSTVATVEDSGGGGAGLRVERQDMGEEDLPAGGGFFFTTVV